MAAIIARWTRALGPPRLTTLMAVLRPSSCMIRARTCTSGEVYNARYKFSQCQGLSHRDGPLFHHRTNRSMMHEHSLHATLFSNESDQHRKMGTHPSMLPKDQFQAPMFSNGYARHMTTKTQPSTTAEGKPDFKPFYYFPYIVHMRLFSRFKFAQTALTVSLVPLLYFGEWCGISAGVDKSIVLSLATLALTMLYAMGEFFRRLVGYMYLSQDQTKVKLSHLTFWGKRRDIVIPLSDIVPLRDYAEDIVAVSKVRRYSTRNFLLISLKYGRVLDRERFSAVFGELPSAENLE